MLLITKEMNEIFRGERDDATGSIRHEKFETLERQIESTLKRLIEIDIARSKTIAGDVPKIGGGRVKSLVAFHEERAGVGPRGETLAGRLIELRQWLKRQGAQLTADGKVIWRGSEARVLWDNELQQVATKVHLRGRLLLKSDDSPLDTSKMVTHFSGPGYAIYVMSKEGNLHVSSHSAGQRHHSSLLAGAAVAGAGELRAINGELRMISNKSGHYWPEPFHLVQVIRKLMEDGLPDFGYTVVCRGGSKENFVSAREFLESEDLPESVVEEVVDTPYDEPD